MRLASMGPVQPLHVCHNGDARPSVYCLLFEDLLLGHTPYRASKSTSQADVMVAPSKWLHLLRLSVMPAHLTAVAGISNVCCTQLSLKGQQSIPLAEH